MFTNSFVLYQQRLQKITKKVQPEYTTRKDQLIFPEMVYHQQISGPSSKSN